MVGRHEGGLTLGCVDDAEQTKHLGLRTVHPLGGAICTFFCHKIVLSIRPSRRCPRPCCCSLVVLTGTALSLSYAAIRLSPRSSRALPSDAVLALQCTCQIAHRPVFPDDWIRRIRSDVTILIMSNNILYVSRATAYVCQPKRFLHNQSEFLVWEFQRQFRHSWFHISGVYACRI